ncbi:DUF5988 family protein [Streptomyces sp. NPDC004539]|uniref:DUF5988 family protein n=1 Tax=Streptomyces sp. NPDC004539 TaxID=3154280 RepID=UPI0033A02515
MSQLKVVLSGGPLDFPEKEREQIVSVIAEKIKHRWGAGYEHFVHDGEFATVDGEKVAVYHWERRTAIAE